MDEKNLQKPVKHIYYIQLYGGVPSLYEKSKSSAYAVLMMDNCVSDFMHSKRRGYQFMEVREVFADKIGRISFVGGMVRFDFVSLYPTADGKSAEKVVQHIVMPLKGFFDMLSANHGLIEKLIQNGTLKPSKRAAAKTAAKPAAKAPRKSARKPKKSEPASDTLL